MLKFVSVYIAGFFEMVELFFDKAANLLEPHLVDTMKGRISREEKEKKVRGILRMVKPVNRWVQLLVKFVWFR